MHLRAFASRAPLVAIAALSSCTDSEAGITDEELELLGTLADLPAPAPDRSNRVQGNPLAEALGQKFYFDPGFSGNSTLKDMLNRDIPAGRAAKGSPVNISCNTCHQVSQGGSDHSSVPRNVSIGAGAYDVNGMQTVNAAQYKLIYWNGRNDSLWAQIVAVAESPVSMGGNRLRTMWRIVDGYRAEYEAVFPDHPLPVATTTLAAQKALLATDGQCLLDGGGACPATACAADPDGTCWPRFPLQGRPGAMMGCQRGDTTEPFGDAYDCMAAEDKDLVTRVYVDFAKAIAAYEYTLTSGAAPFDQWIHEGRDSDAISDEAKRGAKLFIGKAACVDCHDTPLFSDAWQDPSNTAAGFHNVGVPQLGAYVPTELDCPDGGRCDCVDSAAETVGPVKNCLPWGTWDGLQKLQNNGFRRDSRWSDDASDTSRSIYYLDQDLPDPTELAAPLFARAKGAWKTPSLRDCSLTGPYMHNGMYETLAEVVWHYNAGGLAGGDVPGEKDPRIEPLLLDEGEIYDLVEFLETLTGAPLPAEKVTAPTLPPPSAF